MATKGKWSNYYPCNTLDATFSSSLNQNIEKKGLRHIKLDAKKCFFETCSQVAFRHLLIGQFEGFHSGISTGAIRLYFLFYC